MIPRTIPTWHMKSWQEELTDLITSPRELWQLLQLDPALLPAAEAAHQLFAVRTTRAFASRIEIGNPADPLLRQIVPLGYELQASPHFVEDPLEEAAASPCPGIIHKYYGRVLLIAASQCAINCRYCFRRHFDYQGHALSREQWKTALNYVASDPSISEVILSGGDPLVLADKQLHWLINELELIPHLIRLRLHTRLPVVAPARITDELADILTGSRLQTVLVLHCNHANEIDEQVAAALQKLAQKGVVLLNQSVLLRGINDNIESLVALSNRLFENKVMPYYLHLLDRVKGAMHFEVEQDTARALMLAVSARLPGFLVPKLVKEIANAPSKTTII